MLKSDMRIDELWSYPVKSSAGITRTTITLGPAGVQSDREFMLIDNKHRFITARQFPQLTQVYPSLSKDMLNLKTKNQADISIPLTHLDIPTCEVTIWDRKTLAYPIFGEVNTWFSDFLGISCQLVARKQFPFVDAVPLLIIAHASLQDLNTRLKVPVSMQHFRPNIVINNTTSAYEEESWDKFKIGTVALQGESARTRCIFTTIDPQTGIKDADREPFKTLGAYRKNADNKTIFGLSATPIHEGKLHVGDRVQIIPS